MKHWSVLLAFLFFSVAAQASIEKEIAKCAVKSGDLDRLSCYDNLAKREGLSGPQEEPTKISGKGNWQVSVKTNPVDDSKTVVLALRADSGKSKWGKPVTLMARCKSNTTELYISWNDYLGRNAEVLTRVGSQDAVTKDWSLSTDSQATFHPRGTISVSVHSTTFCRPAEIRHTVTSHFPARGYPYEKAPHSRTVADPG